LILLQLDWDLWLGCAAMRPFSSQAKGGIVPWNWRACSNFSIAGPYNEWLTLGAVAYHFDGKLEWDSAKWRFTNNNQANDYLKPACRKGWELKL